PHPTATYTLSLHDALPIYYADGTALIAVRQRPEEGVDRHAQTAIRAQGRKVQHAVRDRHLRIRRDDINVIRLDPHAVGHFDDGQDRKSTRLNSSHVKISYA